MKRVILVAGLAWVAVVGLTTWAVVRKPSSTGTPEPEGAGSRQAEDATRLESLSASGAELRSQFNQDKDYTRLVMLLSPT